VILPFLVFLAFLISGIDDRPSGMRFSYSFMIVYVVMVVTALAVSRLGVIDWLPWSRRRTFALFSLPLLVSVAIGYGLGEVVRRTGTYVMGDEEQLCLAHNRHTDDYYLCVLPAASRISWKGAPPEITTPWGESREPWNRPVVKGLPMRAYYPYSVHSGSSPEFAALQISRAVESLYQVHISPDEIQSRYLSERSDGTVGLKGDGLALEADYGLIPVRDGVYFPWILAAIVVMWALLLAGYMGWLRSGVSLKRRKVLAWVFIAVPMLFWVLDFFLEAMEISTIMARNTLFIQMGRALGASTAGTIATWVVSALAAWGAYTIAQRRFERAELIPDPSDSAAFD
jgi:hypothetical protein